MTSCDIAWHHMTCVPSVWNPYQWGKPSHQTPHQGQWTLIWPMHSTSWPRHGGHCCW